MRGLSVTLIGVEVCGLVWVESCHFTISSSVQTLVWSCKLSPFRSSLGFLLQVKLEALRRAQTRYGWAANSFLSEQLVGDCQL